MFVSNKVLVKGDRPPILAGGPPIMGGGIGGGGSCEAPPGIGRLGRGGGGPPMGRGGADIIILNYGLLYVNNICRYMRDCTQQCSLCLVVAKDASIDAMNG
mmetsp:Transcript_15522/g.39089  ORF Transcript_15522/g.39089 Transcript_15522/m.39089 type:complete len:101 (-) Transcript_15522:58-360(-)